MKTKKEKTINKNKKEAQAKPPLFFVRPSKD